MELRQLRYFVSIVDLGSFTKAAEVLFITQPTLSWNIRKLEEEFGVTLLDRHFNGVQLTERGPFYTKDRAETWILWTAFRAICTMKREEYLRKLP